MRMEFPDRRERIQYDTKRRLIDAHFWRIRTDGGNPVMYGTFDVLTGSVIDYHFYAETAAVPQHHRDAALELLERFARLYRKVSRFNPTHKEKRSCLTSTI
jgi:hypothetical protein